MNKQFYSSSRDWNKLLCPAEFKKFVLFSWLFFSCFVLSSFSRSGFTVALHSWANQTITSGTPPPAEESPVLGGAGPPGNLPEEKRPPSVRGAGKPPRVKRVIPRQVGRKYHQGVLAVLFPFFREDIHQFPLQSTSGFSLREKNPKTHGAPAGQDSVPQGGSQGRARSSGDVENRIPGYQLRYHNTCGIQYIFHWRQLGARCWHCACVK